MKCGIFEFPVCIQATRLYPDEEKHVSALAFAACCFGMFAFWGAFWFFRVHSGRRCVCVCVTGVFVASAYVDRVLS